jgi:putative two-component system response regulator
MRVLIVDDDEFALNVLEGTLSRMGYTAVTARDGGEALNHLRQGDIRLMVTDWDMPGMNGIELCRSVRKQDLSGYVYIIMLTGREGAKQRMAGLCAGADAFLNKPLDPEELLICLKTAERILSLETREVALFALAKLAESRDSETGAHVERVQSYTRLLARELSIAVKDNHGVDDEYVRLLYQTSPLHDLGKVGIPDAILLKPGKLTPGEFTIMKTHTIVGAQTLDAALQRFPNVRFLQMAREIAATHHEKFDGSGYPQGLIGEQIPLCGRIVALADVYDALTSRRVYKAAMTHEQAKAIILASSGSHFDPEIIEAFVRAESQIVAVWERLRDASDPAVQDAAVPLPPPSSECNAASNGILVVEDDALVLQKLMDLLAATGESVYSATEGEEAMRVLAARHPRVVISDWEMPKVDGVELCRQIRLRCDASPIHFIMLTAHSDKHRLLDAYRAGVDDFVSKPFDQEELLARVRAGLRATQLYDELVRSAADSQALNGQLATVNSRLERLSITDELTGLFNRRQAILRLEEQWALAEKYGKPLSIAIADIDHFKKINDTYGHPAGDMILRHVAKLFRDEIRGTDTLCRVGGEEFLIIFPSQSAEEAQICVERCRVAIAAHSLDVNGINITATISIGLASRVPAMPQFPDLLKAADEALYAAKHDGRNTVRIAEHFKEQPHMKNSQENGSLVSSGVAVVKAPPVDLSAVLKRCGGDAKFAAAVTERFRAQATDEVIRIEQALASGDIEAMRRAAHSLKSMTAYMAADSASELAKQIEDFGRANQLTSVPQLLVRLRQEVGAATAWITQNALSAPARCA